MLLKISPFWFLRTLPRTDMVCQLWSSPNKSWVSMGATFFTHRHFISESGNWFVLKKKTKHLFIRFLLDLHCHIVPFCSFIWVVPHVAVWKYSIMFLCLPTWWITNISRNVWLYPKWWKWCNERLTWWFIRVWEFLLTQR